MSSRKKLRTTALAELDALEGMQPVKQQVRELLALMKNQRARRRQNLRNIHAANHMVLSGNPGTGKTTVARTLAKTFYALGTIKSDKFLEVDKKDLVGEYLGQTEAAMKKLFQEVPDGVIFFDEAYSLAEQYSTRSYGQEVIDLLVKFMENHRERVIVIVAGYTDKMEIFLDSNPGLKSRFKHYLKFEDYTPHALCRIFSQIAEQHDYCLAEDGKLRVALVAHAAYAFRGEGFSNARLIRNLFEEAVTKQASRLKPQATTSELQTLIADDVQTKNKELQHIDFSFLSGINTAAMYCTWGCPECRTQVSMNYQNLAETYDCKCGLKLIVPWWAVPHHVLPSAITGNGQLPQFENELVLASKYVPPKESTNKQTRSINAPKKQSPEPPTVHDRSRKSPPPVRLRDLEPPPVYDGPSVFGPPAQRPASTFEHLLIVMGLIVAAGSGYAIFQVVSGFFAPRVATQVERVPFQSYSSSLKPRGAPHKPTLWDQSASGR